MNFKPKFALASLRWMLAAVAAFVTVGAGSRVAADEIDYHRDVYPIFEAYCVGCHTQDEAQGGLVMESFGELMTGGDSGLAITTGSAASSRLYLMAAGKLEPVMPPDDMEGPSADELQIIADWIDAGASGPDGDPPIKRPIRVPKIDPATESFPVTAIAVSPDGNRTARGGVGQLRIEDADGKAVQTIRGDFGKVNSIEFDRSSSRVLIGSGSTGSYGQALIYDVAGGRLQTELVGHSDVLYAAVWSPDEATVATAGYDRDILLWDVDTGEQTAVLSGHNGAIFDLAFSPDGRHLVSACADETAKVWDVASGRRLDTLSQSEGEVYAAGFTPDGQHVVALSEDQRLRVWQFVSTDSPRINPLIASRVVDDSPLTHFAFAGEEDSPTMVIASGSGRLKLIRTSDWRPVAEMESVDEAISDLAVAPEGPAGRRGDAGEVLVSLMDGRVVRRTLPPIGQDADWYVPPVTPVYMDLPMAGARSELELPAGGSIDLAGVSTPVRSLVRGAIVNGSIDAPGQSDLYSFQAGRGEVWAIDVDRASGSAIDPIVSVLDERGELLLRTRLQAVRDTYFTFRGKNSNQADDFRVFNWQEIGLNSYLYANGEVTRTWLHPRGADSGFTMYPGHDKRWTYFGTSQITHALGEPAYIVRELQPGEPAEPNGLPVFEIGYENDDDPMKQAGNQSRLILTAPVDGRLIVRVGDTRSMGGENFGYQLRVRPATPSYDVAIKEYQPKMLSGAGRDFKLLIRRNDGFDGPVTFDIDGLDDRIEHNFPVVVQEGQDEAVAMFFAPVGTESLDTTRLKITATADVLGRRTERRFEMDPPQIEKATPIKFSVQPIDRDVPFGEVWTLSVARGETVRARIVMDRDFGHDYEVRFGSDDAARGAPHGAIVDNIGLVGLLVLEGQSQREMFITVDPVTQPGRRRMHIKGQMQGGITSPPIVLDVR